MKKRILSCVAAFCALVALFSFGNGIYHSSKIPNEIRDYVYSTGVGVGGISKSKEELAQVPPEVLKEGRRQQWIAGGCFVLSFVLGLGAFVLFFTPDEGSRDDEGLS